MERYGWGLDDVRRTPLSAVSALLEAAAHNTAPGDPEEKIATPEEVAAFHRSLAGER